MWLQNEKEKTRARMFLTLYASPWQSPGFALNEWAVSGEPEGRKAKSEGHPGGGSEMDCRGRETAEEARVIIRGRGDVLGTRHKCWRWLGVVSAWIFLGGRIRPQVGCGVCQRGGFWPEG